MRLPKLSLPLTQAMLSKAPLPSSDKPYGLRPHVHFDSEELFTDEEKHNLKTRDGRKYVAGSRLRVLWAFPLYWNYELERQLSRKQRKLLDPGVHRIITDRYKNVIGVVTHPIGDRRAFIRARRRVRGDSNWIIFVCFFISFLISIIA